MESPAQFTPSRKASTFGRVLVLIFGPIMWLVAVVVVAVVVYGRDAIEFGVIVTFIAFLVSLALCWAGRRRRVHQEEAAETS